MFPDDYPEEELPDDLSKEEISKLEAIESLWNKLVVKSDDPVNTILKICEQARHCFEEIDGFDEYYGSEDIMMLFGEFLSKFPICTKCIEELYGKNPQREELQSKLYNAIMNGYISCQEFKESEGQDKRDREWYSLGDTINPAQQEINVINEAMPLYEKMLSDLVAGKTEEKSDVEVVGESPLSDKSLDELLEIAAANDKVISQNNKAIKGALIQRILGQQKKIKEQEAEMQSLSVSQEI